MSLPLAAAGPGGRTVLHQVTWLLHSPKPKFPELDEFSLSFFLTWQTDHVRISLKGLGVGLAQPSAPGRRQSLHDVSIGPQKLTLIVTGCSTGALVLEDSVSTSNALKVGATVEYSTESGK